jgi:hypothetical protein
VFFLVVVSAGTACGIGSSDGPIFLLIFELAGFAVQLVTSRSSNQPVESPIPLA